MTATILPPDPARNDSGRGKNFPARKLAKGTRGQIQGVKPGKAGGRGKGTLTGGAEISPPVNDEKTERQTPQKVRQMPQPLCRRPRSPWPRRKWWQAVRNLPPQSKNVSEIIATCKEVSNAKGGTTAGGAEISPPAADEKTLAANAKGRITSGGAKISPPEADGRRPRPMPSLSGKDTIPARMGTIGGRRPSGSPRSPGLALAPRTLTIKRKGPVRSPTIPHGGRATVHRVQPG